MTYWQDWPEQPIILAPGAEHVPVRPYWSVPIPTAEVVRWSRVSERWLVWQEFVCCGPAAPAPMPFDPSGWDWRPNGQGGWTSG